MNKRRKRWKKSLWRTMFLHFFVTFSDNKACSYTEKDLKIANTIVEKINGPELLPEIVACILRGVKNHTPDKNLTDKAEHEMLKKLELMQTKKVNKIIFTGDDAGEIEFLAEEAQQLIKRLPKVPGYSKLMINLDNKINLSPETYYKELLVPALDQGFKALGIKKNSRIIIGILHHCRLYNNPTKQTINKIKNRSKTRKA